VCAVLASGTELVIFDNRLAMSQEFRHPISPIAHEMCSLDAVHKVKRDRDGTNMVQCIRVRPSPRFDGLLGAVAAVSKVIHVIVPSLSAIYTSISHRCVLDSC